MIARRIRPDEGALLRTVRLCALAGASDAFGTTLAQALEDTDEQWRLRAADSASSESASLFFVEHDGAVVGMAGGYFEPAKRVPSLISMWVEPSSRGRGAGEVLVGAVVEWAQAN